MDIDSGHAGTLEWLVSRLNESAPKFDSDDSPRWLLREALESLSKKQCDNLMRDLGNWVFPKPFEVVDMMGLLAKQIAVSVELVLPLPEWVTE